MDNSIFTLLAYTNFFLNTHEIRYSYIFWLILSQYLIKVSYETMMSPLSVKFSQWLKNKEKIDIYDIHTNFSLFRVSVDEIQHENRYLR